MNESIQGIPFFVLTVGAAIIVSILLKSWLKRIGVPGLIGFIILGFGIRCLDGCLGIFGEPGFRIFEFLGSVGMFTLLFKVCLESDLSGLLRQQKLAGAVAASGIIFSAVLGYVTAYYLLELGMIPSLFAGIAMTATSVGVSTGTWQSRNALQTRNGELLIDIAEMDDILGVVLMGLLFAVAPTLHNGGGNSSIIKTVALSATKYFIMLFGFGLLCFLFSRYLEKSMTNFFKKITPAPDPMLLVAGVGIIIAALAGLLGFSVAIGAFLAGLAFSRDQSAVKMEASFNTLYDFFMPFFFIGIGLKIDPAALGNAFQLGPVLLVAAILAKLIGNGAAMYLFTGFNAALLIGVSTIPRAEITLIIMEHGLQLGNWAVPAQLYAAMVLVAAITCIGAPITLRPLLQKLQPREKNA